jgi:hypothetical protein
MVFPTFGETTVTVEFESLTHRAAVHDAIKGRASVLGDSAELTYLFRLGDVIAYCETNNLPHTSIEFSFDDAQELQACRETLQDASIDELAWLGHQL